MDIQGYLQITNPKHHPHDPFPISTVVEAATLLLSSPTSSFPFLAFDIQVIAPSPQPPAPIQSKENVNLKALENPPPPAFSQIIPPTTKDMLAANFTQTNSMIPKVPIMLTPIISTPPISIPPPAPSSSFEVQNGVIKSDDFAHPKNSRDILDEDLGLIKAEATVLSCTPQTHSQIKLVHSPPQSGPECDKNSSMAITQHKLLANTLNFANFEAIVSTTVVSTEEHTEPPHCTDIKSPPLHTPSISVKSYAYASIDSTPNTFPTGLTSSSSTQSKVLNEHEEIIQHIDTSLQEVSNCIKDYKGVRLTITLSPEHYQVAHELSSKPSKELENLPVPPTTHLPCTFIPSSLCPCIIPSMLSFDGYPFILLLDAISRNVIFSVFYSIVVSYSLLVTFLTYWTTVSSLYYPFPPSSFALIQFRTPPTSGNFPWLALHILSLTPPLIYQFSVLLLLD
ncbi:hypothetical protein BDQ17DRAFT_1433082 [Cyathus striatus]|nr:hypothetical protein BDQ17DRAFT_1433082 [Cyathus striatus]